MPMLAYTRADALKTLKSAPARSIFMLAIKWNLPVGGKGAYYPGMACAKVTRKEAIHAVEEALSEIFDAKGAHIMIDISRSTLNGGATYYFIGA